MPLNERSAASLQMLTRYLERVKSESTSKGLDVIMRRTGDAVEASEEQQQIWLHSELAGDAPIYNEPVTLRFRGSLNASAFEKAFNYFLDRHEAWRTSFVWANGKLMQSVLPEIRANLPVLDLRELPEREREPLAIRLAANDARAPFDLAKPPLFRARLVRFREEDFRLYLTVHHIMLDGVSTMQILVPELEAAYNAFLQGKEPSLPPVPFQCPDYALWQQKWLASGELESNLRYWERTFASGLPPSRLPVDRAPSWARSFSGGTVLFELGPDLRDSLKFIAQTSETTMFMTLLAAFHVLLYQQTDICDHIVSTVMSSRVQTGSDQVLGYFLNTVLLGASFSPDQSFRSLLATVKDRVLGALSHPAPFQRVMNRIARTGDSRTQARAMFILDPPLKRASQTLDLMQHEVDTGLSKFDLCLWMEERNGYLGRFNFRRDIFDQSTILRLKRNWTGLLEAIGRAPDLSIGELAHSVKIEPETVSTKTKNGPRLLRSIWRGRS